MEFCTDISPLICRIKKRIKVKNLFYCHSPDNFYLCNLSLIHTGI